jgi:hypothetical protein
MARQSGAAVATRTVQRSPSATTRKTLATQKIMTHLAASENEKDKAITAVLEAVSERLDWDRALQQSVREKYEELRTLAPSRQTGQKAKLGPMPQPKPSSTLATHNPLANTNPYELAEEYEHRDFRAVLDHAGRDPLREMVGVIGRRNPGIKLPNRNQLDAMRDFIVQQVLGPGW